MKKWCVFNMDGIDCNICLLCNALGVRAIREIRVIGTIGIINFENKLISFIIIKCVLFWV